MRLDAIPARLQNANQWVVWRYQVRSGKRTKVPYNATTGKPASTTDSATWSAFAKAWEAYTGQEYDGIGFVFSKHDKFLGLDFDHVRDKDGELASWVLRIVSRVDSYAELSPSGEGAHIIIETDEELDHGNRFSTIGAEIYTEGRYFTVTGELLPGANSNVAHRNQEFRDAYSSLHTTHALIQEIRRRVRNGDDELGKLWDGDSSGYDGDQSRADLALASRLVHHAKGDTVLADSVFRHSGLMRPKWDETRGAETYGQQTLRKAELDATTQAAQTTITAGPLPLTDAGNVQRMAAICGDDTKYSPEFGWLSYTGSVWKRDDTAPWTATKRVTQAIAAEAVAAQDKRARAQIHGWSVQSQGHTHIKAMVELARKDPAFRMHSNAFDNDPWLLNCTNGTVDLRTGALRPHAREDHLTHQCTIAYNPYASAPAWEAFLHRIFDGDGELIRFIQRAVGYSLTGLVTERAFFILHGRGANGKTTFIEALTQILGDYTAKSRVETFMQKKGGGGIPNDVAALVGRRFVVTSESEAGMRLSEGLIKELTGGDSIQARFLRQEFFEFKPHCKLWIATNHKPDIRGTDDGIWTRVKLVPFTVQIPEAEQVSRDIMLRTFWDEAPGILAWAVAGCREWQAQRLNAPTAVVEATAEYREESDILNDFFGEYCELGSGYKVDMQTLYQAYTNWAGSNGTHALSINAFGKAMSDRKFEKARSNGGPVYRKGLKLRAGVGALI